MSERPVIRGEIETSTRQNYIRSTRTEEWSQPGELVRDACWLPDKDGKFHYPQELLLEDLHPDLKHDLNLAHAMNMKKDKWVELAESANLNAEFLKWQIENPEEAKRLYMEFVAHKTNMRADHIEKPEFPVRKSSNPEQRSKKVRENAGNRAAKKYEKRERSVRTTRSEIEPEIQLRNLYTNDDGQLICQICKLEMPFKKRNGQHYFEAVEVFSNLLNENEAQFLALCPLCAAKYKEFVKRDEDAQERLRSRLFEAELTELEVDIELGTEETTIRFVETHFIDLQTIL